MAVQLYVIAVNEKLPTRFERKYYLTPGEVGLAYGILRQTCVMDTEYPSEQINSLYFDTVDLDQYERSSSGDFQKDKIRIRWYGNGKKSDAMKTIFIELKSRQGFTSIKQRLKLPVPADTLTIKNLRKGIIPRTMLMNTLAGFGYFLPEVFQPVIKISYRRYRFSEIVTGQRVSLDCHIRSTMIIPEPGNGEKELELPGGVIEIKGQSMELPITLERLRILYTDWTRFSKYSGCIDSHSEKPGTIGRLSPSGRIVRLKTIKKENRRINMLEELTTLLESPLGVSEAVIRVGFSLLASVVAYLMYQLFYGSRHIGAGVHRAFIIGGPAITLIFLVIQTSILLGLGLLGALSFVRFRTPIKDPAEIGFLLLLIASSIGMATGNMIPTLILFAIVFIALGVHRLLSNRVTLSGRGHLMISIDQPSFPALEKKLSAFLKEKLRGLSLDTMSTMDDRISLHYQYRRQSEFDWTAFTNELNQLAGTAKVEVFVG